MILFGGPAGHLLQCKPSNTRLCLLVSAELFLAPQYFVILIHDLYLRQSSSSLLPLVIRRSQLTIPLLDAMHHEHLACAPSGHIYPGVGNSTPTLSAPYANRFLRKSRFCSSNDLQRSGLCTSAEPLPTTTRTTFVRNCLCWTSSLRLQPAGGTRCHAL